MALVTTGGGNRFVRGRRLGGRARFENQEDIEIDEQRSPSENLTEALKYLVTKEEENGPAVSKGKQLAYLNALVKIIRRMEKKGKKETLFSDLRLKEILLCLRIPLVHESVEVRAATLRVIRFIITEPKEIQELIELNIHLIISRCLDIDLDNKIERIQALRLSRKLLIAGPSYFPMCLCRSLVAIAEGGSKENDRLLRICLATLCELSVLNSHLFISCLGVRALTNSLLDCSMPRVAEAIIGSLLRLYNMPETRSEANINLGVVIAPFTEFRYVHNWYSQQKHQQQHEDDDDKHLRFACSEQAILCILRSWPGILQFGNPSDGSASPLKALIDSLYLPNNEVRNQIIDLLYDSLYLRVPKSTDNISAAIRESDPSTFRDSWKLAEGFVASEGLDILPHLAKSRPNLKENHKCMILSCYLKAHLPEALIKVIVSSDVKLSIKATILLGDLLHLTFLLLPREINFVSHCLPSLLDEIATSDLKRSHRASQAVSALHKLHSIKKRGPRACSLFFHEILSNSGRFRNGECFIGDRLQTPSAWSRIKLSEDRVNMAIKQSNVLKNDISTWLWDLIAVVFKCPNDTFIAQLDNSSTNRDFIWKILDFFKPSNGYLSKIELSDKKAKEYGWTGCIFLDFLVSATSGSNEAQRCLDEFLDDINTHFQYILASTDSIDECLLSPTRVASTACQYYFLFLGHLSRSQGGRDALMKHTFLSSFIKLLGLRSNLYLKLVISSLDYSDDWGSRAVLERALREDQEENSRLYTTRFLGVLIRSRTPNVAQWGINYLISQLFDASPIISSTALEILDEACDDKMNLEAVVCSMSALMQKIIEGNQFRGRLILSRFLSSVNGFKVLNQGSFLENELKKWSSEYNYKYVTLIEELLNDGFTHHQHEDDHTYGRRTYAPHSVRDVFIPPHLYGQLATCKEGLSIILKEPTFWDMLSILRQHEITENNINLKSAIWAVCHVAASPEGAEIIHERGALEHIVKMATSCNNYAIRGTAYYALSLVATNRVGTNALASLGWYSLRYSREEQWPVHEDWFVGITTQTRVSPHDYFPSSDICYDVSFIPRGFKISSLLRSLSLSSKRGTLSEKSRRSSEGRPSLTKKIRNSLTRHSTSMQSKRSLCDSSVSETSYGGSSDHRVEDFSKGLSFESESLVVEERDDERKIIDCENDGGNDDDIDDNDDDFCYEVDDEKYNSGQNGLEKIAEEAAAATTSTGVTDHGFDFNDLTGSSELSYKFSEHKQTENLRNSQRALSDGETFLDANATFQRPNEGGTENGNGLGHSISSSIDDNSGYYTIRSIHQRRRPPLNESDVDHKPEKLKRSNSWTLKFRSLDNHFRKNTSRFTGLKTEPRYWGITLPGNHVSLFPPPSTSHRKMKNIANTSSCENEEEKKDGLPVFHGGLELHNFANCLACYHLMLQRSRTSSASSSEKLLTCASTNSVNSTSSISDQEDGNHIVVGRVYQRKEVLKLIGNMMHFGTKPAEQGLLMLKQKFPNIFNDLCLYSEVSLILSKYSYRLSSRRFIQELFIDLKFEEFYEEPAKILGLANAKTLGKLTEIESCDIFTMRT